MPLAGVASQVPVSDGAPLNYFIHAAGPAAGPTLRLDWIFTAICVAVCVIVGGLLSAAILRRRPDAPFAATRSTARTDCAGS